MKKHDLLPLLNTFAMPVTLIVLGAVALFDPDAVSVFFARIVAWLLLITGICCGVCVLLGNPQKRIPRFICALTGTALGVILLKHPLILIEGIENFLGLLLLLEGIHDLRTARKRGRVLPVLPIISAVIGGLLIFVPMTASRIIFNICGIVVVCIGIASLIDRLRGIYPPGEPRDPNIIDADE